MKTSKSQWLSCSLLFIASLSCMPGKSSARKVSDEFKFLVTPKMFYAVPFGSNFKLSCTTNDETATTQLYHRQSIGSAWNLLSPTPGKLIKSGQVYTVLGFGISNAGQYQCRATNGSGTTIKWSDRLANLIPNPSLTPPLDIHPRRAVVLTTGQSYNVTCSSVPQSTLKWFKKYTDGSETAVPSNQIHTEKDLEINKLKVVLMFKNAQKNDAGIYICKMTYQGKGDFKYSTLEVYDRFKFRRQPKRFSIVGFGASLTIACTTNELNADVSLYHRGSPSKPWKQLVPDMKRVFKNSQTFVISNFGISDVGHYQCRGRNRRGNTIRWKEGSGIVLAHPILTPPVTIEPKHAVVLTEGQSRNITCTSVDRTTLQWFKELANGTIIPVPTSKTVEKRDRNKFSVILMFRDAKKKDSGSYKCLMTFQGRRSHKYASLTVMDKGTSPHLKGRKKMLSVDETSRVVMSCNAKGDPLPNITWYKGSNLINCLSNGKPCGPLLQYTLKNRIKTKNTSKIVRSQLKISRTNRVRDQGNYICVASNKHGVAHRSYQLTVN
ncbi:hemicentin-2-like [Actinia tenebrosa]|uniref:Hemicentin-2-like n=1 Tax=Actinia tenebrosa TaxID=6105 RepID=A0A6P8HLP3_ACTTE|nr:hemicentin-2-like [Actinia tenebrosa]